MHSHTEPVMELSIQHHCDMHTLWLASAFTGTHFDWPVLCGQHHAGNLLACWIWSELVGYNNAKPELNDHVWGLFDVFYQCVCNGHLWSFESFDFERFSEVRKVRFSEVKKQQQKVYFKKSLSQTSSPHLHIMYNVKQASITYIALRTVLHTTELYIVGAFTLTAIYIHIYNFPYPNPKMLLPNINVVLGPTRMF